MNPSEGINARQIAGRHIDACRETLSHPRVQDALGERAVVLMGLLDNLYVADDSDSTQMINLEHDDYIPLIVTSTMKPLKYHPPAFNSMHTAQVAKLKEYLEFYEIGDTSDTALRRYATIVGRDAERQMNKNLLKSMPEGTAACVTSNNGMLRLPATGVHGSTKLHVSTRPYMLLDAEQSPGDGEIMIHELVHVEQEFDMTVLPDVITKNDYTSWELEAYHVQAMVGRALRRRNHHNYRHAYNVEKLRRSTRDAGADPFAVTPALQRSLRPRGYDFQFCPR